MSLFRADLRRSKRFASSVVADFIRFPYSEFGVCILTNAKQFGTVQSKKHDVWFAPRWHISCLAATSLAFACFRHRAQWNRIQIAKMCGHRWFLLIGISNRLTSTEKTSIVGAHSLIGATFSSFRLLAKHLTTSKVSSNLPSKLASTAASIHSILKPVYRQSLSSFRSDCISNSLVSIS